MPHMFRFSSAVDHAPELALAIGRRTKAPTCELLRKAGENLAVRQPLALQSPMAAAHELLRPLIEKRQHLVDQPRRLSDVQPGRTNQIGDEIPKLGWLRHRGSILKSEKRNNYSA